MIKFIFVAILFLGMLFSGFGQDIRQNRVVMKYYPPETIQDILNNHPEKQEWLKIYFNESFEILVTDANPVKPFISELFDVRQYESARLNSERSNIQLPDQGVTIVLWSTEELYSEYYKRLKDSETLTGSPGYPDARMAAGDYADAVEIWKSEFPEEYQKLKASGPKQVIDGGEFSQMPLEKQKVIQAEDHKYIIQ